ncbi:MAG: M14 family metallopeptidase [Chitinophagaceae bacterium]
MKKQLTGVFLCVALLGVAQPLVTRFEKSAGLETATYFEAIDYYRQLDKASPKMLLKEMGPTDAGYNLHLVLFSADCRFDPVAWHNQGKVVVMVNNGIHPGEPDGIDASMMFLRDLTSGKLTAPPNVVFGVIPVYNIGGCLNRGTTSRANQNGPLEYGFRGNSQNLDLNRDFTKNDSKESRSFAQIFHFLDPDILIDNHVSDGADYQHTITMLTTQYNKLGDDLGEWLRNSFEPGLYKGMKAKNWDMFPYVNFETASPAKGMEQFYDPPRYSSGYAALWQCIGFVPETHMLKPYKDRVSATYAFMLTVMEEASAKAVELRRVRKKAVDDVKLQNRFPLSWRVDSTKTSSVTFKGYEQAFKKSEVTGTRRMYYDHSKPFTADVKFFNQFIGEQIVSTPLAYIIPQGWYAVVDLLRNNRVVLTQLSHDTTIEVEAYHIDDYKSSPRAYEKHHRNTDTKLIVSKESIRFLKGDYIVNMDQRANRYLAEMLEPAGDDSFFSWNFFDAILQQKEGYSDYRWEDVAAGILKNSPDIKSEFEQNRTTDTAFAANPSAQLNWVYKHSPYYEAGHLRYPVYRVIR